MSSKAVIVFCAQALLAQVVFSQCIRSGVENRRLVAPSVGITPCGTLGVNSLGFGEGFGFGSGLGIGGGIGSGFAGVGVGSASFASGGGAFTIESLALLAPNGIAVTSDNVYEGALGVVGELPFLSTVALEGVLPSAGVGLVNHGCGNGITAITSEIDNSAGLIGGHGIGAGIIGAGGIGAGFGSGIIGAGVIGSGIVGAGGIGSGIIGAGGIGCGTIGSGIGSGAIGHGLGGIGAFTIESLAPLAPNGIAVTSDNVYEGALGVVGELPFLSTVALEGVLPSAGVGLVNHGCGNGITAITSEMDNSAGLIGGNGIGAGIIGAGSVGAGFGSGIIGAGVIGSGIVGAGGIGSGIIGAGGIGCGIIGSEIGSGTIGHGLGGIGVYAGRGCGCGW